ncbi:exodeoxyribonuclease VII small subunit [Mycobacterium sp.]|uniref:exodeoxyribonuclease VII small subunit n=1 Tax=Mycobacterium sp. TaxID=1785 RepID=UPI003A83EC32
MGTDSDPDALDDAPDPDAPGPDGGTTTPISELGYERCRDELIDVVRRLEEGGLDLDASLQLWERGEKLAKRCEEHLAGAHKRVADTLAAGEAEG